MKVKKLAWMSSLALAAGGYGLYRWTYRMPLKDYTRYALYMAVLDDEICRNELEGMQLDGGRVVFPEKSESLQYRYHLFLEMNRRKSRKVIRKEILELKERLRESRQNQCAAEQSETGGIPHRLWQLMTQFAEGNQPIEEFCGLFECYYEETENFKASDVVKAQLEELADRCARFSRNPEDLKLPNVFHDEAVIRQCVTDLVTEIKDCEQP